MIREILMAVNLSPSASRLGLEREPVHTSAAPLWLEERKPEPRGAGTPAEVGRPIGDKPETRTQASGKFWKAQSASQAPVPSPRPESGSERALKDVS